MRIYEDTTTLSPRVEITSAGLDAALRVFKAASASSVSLARRRTHFISPTERRRYKSLAAQRRLKRRSQTPCPFVPLSLERANRPATSGSELDR